jgi:hypothetical protein
MFKLVILLIILIIIVIIVISSISYDTKTIPLTPEKSIINRSKYNTVSIRGEMENNCNVLQINDLNKNIAYVIDADFNSTCLSLYENNVRIHSRICNGKLTIILCPNVNLVSQILRNTRNKTQFMPLDLNKNYKVVFDNANNLNIKIRKTDYDTVYTQPHLDYMLGIGTNEYDIIKKIESEYSGLTFKRVGFKTTNIENVWEYNGEGDHLCIYTENRFNLELNFENIDSKIQKRTIRDSNEPILTVIKLTDPKLKVTNLDFSTKIKDIHRDYIDFITAPQFLINKFLYGSQDKIIDYTNSVNNKVILYKIV